MKHGVGDEDCTKNSGDILDPAVVHGDHACISFDVFQDGKISFSNNATRKEVARAEENAGEEATGAEENRMRNDEVAMQGRELVTPVQGSCVEHSVEKETMVE